MGVKAASSSAPAHLLTSVCGPKLRMPAALSYADLLVLDGVERHVVARKDNRAAGHVDAVRERLSAQHDAQVA